MALCDKCGKPATELCFDVVDGLVFQRPHTCVPSRRRKVKHRARADVETAPSIATSYRPASRLPKGNSKRTAGYPERPDLPIKRHKASKLPAQPNTNTGEIVASSVSGHQGAVLAQCRWCRAKQAAARLENHIARVHPVIATGPVRETTTRAKNVPVTGTSEKPMVRCSHCSSMVRSDHLAHHFRKVHPAFALVLEPAGSLSTAQRNNVALSHRQNRTANQMTETRSAERYPLDHSDLSTKRTLNDHLGLADLGDATYRVGQYARENGRFGSPVSYDGYGDEDDA